MLFNSFTYLVFLPAVVALYWVVPHRARLLLLLIASYIFYMNWKASYGLLLFGMTVGNYLLGLLVDKASRPATKRLWFIAGITANLGLLALFKYTNFLVDFAWQSLSFYLHLTKQVPLLGTAPELPIILPLGISFFVFEFIHYLSDIFKGQEPIKNPLRFALFAAFFPSQIAGPIKRFEDFDQQARKNACFDRDLFHEGIFFIMQGMFKKVVLGDNLALLVQPGFAHADILGPLDAWLTVLAFTFQIYYDFSGYTDIGRGSAMLLGYRLPENFNMPYLAKNMSEFWHRWHMSLSTWLRDYLYIPLGGSRAGKLLQMRNLMITMLLGGLWHGAAWTFVLWGGYQGLGLIIAHSWQSIAEKKPFFLKSSTRLFWDNLSRFVTFIFVMGGWVLFRAENFPQALSMYRAMAGLAAIVDTDISIRAMVANSILPAAFCLYIGFFFLHKWWQEQNKKAQSKLQAQAAMWPHLSWWLTPPYAARVVSLAALAYLILGMSPHQAIPFIYFQF